MKEYIINIFTSLAASLFVLSAYAAPTAAPAFPGAVGQGAQALGGRGGDVYHVTNLLDYDPQENAITGSLRHAVRSAHGPRTIVFDVGGAIPLRAELKIMNDDLTIAGQTSPGGITLWGYPLSITKSTNVIIRYLRVRTGDFHARRPANMRRPSTVKGNGNLDPGSANGIQVGGGSQRVILDHMSVSWGLDETLSVTHARDVTIQNCMIVESLNESLHPKGAHGYGSLLRGEITAEDQTRGVGGYTFYRNLWAHHRARNPSVGGQQSLDPGQHESERRRTDVNIVNNVIYNWGDGATHRSEFGDVRINLMANAYVCGPAKRARYFFREHTAARTAVFQAGNWQDLDQDQAHDGAEVIGVRQVAAAFQGFGEGDQLTSEGTPFNFSGGLSAHAVAAEKAYAAVLNSAGASLWRDSADERVLISVHRRSGRLINSQEELRDGGGLLPGVDDITDSRRPEAFDTDRDGMPDEFERSRKLDPSDPRDGQLSTLSDEGYPNLEIYLNGLVSEVAKVPQRGFLERGGRSERLQATMANDAKKGSALGAALVATRAD